MPPDTPPRRLGAELTFLLDRHPRAGWDSASIGELARFWLSRHAFFRQVDAAIRAGTAAALADAAEPEAFRPWFARHLNLFLGELEGHHAIEDYQYFPAFRAAEPRLAAGFDLLDADHHAIHEAIEAIARLANDVLKDPRRSRTAFNDELERFHARFTTLGGVLTRHLDDEEDLIIPLLIERGDNQF